jgi:protein-S-isoprenylcysteine O-methyltransferase Ste14
MSQPDPTKETKTPWTAASVALVVIGLLIVVSLGLCTVAMMPQLMGIVGFLFVLLLIPLVIHFTVPRDRNRD